MATLRQINANRKNASISTGPASTAGKRASSFNALKTGIHAESVVLPSENPADRAALVAEYYARFRPTRPEERVYVDDIIQAEWTLRRLRRTETELNGYLLQDCLFPDPDYPIGQAAARNPRVFSALQWRLNATRKARKEALAALRELRENPIPAPVA